MIEIAVESDLMTFSRFLSFSPDPGPLLARFCERMGNEKGKKT